MNQSRLALGKRIRKLRRKAGFTQAQLAEKAELSLKHLGEIERRRGDPCLSSIENLGRALDMTLSQMFEYQHERLSSGQVKTEMYKMIDTANDEECRLVYRLIKAVLK